MSKVSKEEVQQVRLARWDAWRRMAQEMKNHQILAVELLRTEQDETVAVFTVNRNGEPVQFVVRGDSRGRLKDDTRDHGHDHHEHHEHHHHHHHDEHGRHGEPGHGGYAEQSVQLADTTQPMPAMVAMPAMAPAPPPPKDDPASPDIIALGEPPPKQPPPPGITAVGGVLLAGAFDVAEQVPTGSTAR